MSWRLVSDCECWNYSAASAALRRYCWLVGLADSFPTLWNVSHWYIDTCETLVTSELAGWSGVLAGWSGVLGGWMGLLVGCTGILGGWLGVLAGGTDRLASGLDILGGCTGRLGGRRSGRDGCGAARGDSQLVRYYGYMAFPIHSPCPPDCRPSTWGHSSATACPCRRYDTP